MKHKSLTIENINSKQYNFLDLPGTNFFKFEIVNKFGSHLEKFYNKKHNKNVYGLSHLVEHLSFRATKDYSSEELLKLLKEEGNYNASTDYSRVNYWFQTTMEKFSLGVNLVLNIAYNDLTKISENEFEIEKNVVFNEAKRYADDDQTMFLFNAFPTLCGYHKEDNVIGDINTIKTFELNDAIILKEYMLNNEDIVFNITYDSEILTKNEIITEIEKELYRFYYNKKYKISKDVYTSFIKKPERKQIKIQNDSEQSMTALNFDCVHNYIIAEYANEYLSNYANETSLNDIIREQNGLTYGINLYSYNDLNDLYTIFSCDVSRGNEELLLSLFSESLNKTIKSFNKEKYDKFLRTKKLKRQLSLLDQKKYGYWLNLATWYPELLDIPLKDLNESYELLEQKYCTIDNIISYLENIKENFILDKFGWVSNYEV